MPRFFMGKPLESVEHVAFFMENVWFAMGFIVWPLNGKTKEHHLFVKLDMQHMNIKKIKERDIENLGMEPDRA